MPKTIRGYWSEVPQKAWQQLRSFLEGTSLLLRLIPSVLSPVILALQFGMGSPSILRHALIALAESYAIAFLGLYLLLCIRAVPALLRERDAKISGLVGPDVDPDAIVSPLAAVFASIDAGHNLFVAGERKDHDLWRQQTNQMLQHWFGHPAIKRFDDAGQLGPGATTAQRLEWETLYGAREATSRQLEALREIADLVKRGNIAVLRRV
jgi:hypothetical protein